MAINIFCLLFMFTSCKLNNNDKNIEINKITEKIANDSLIIQSVKWKKDSLGCLKYRNISRFKDILNNYKLIDTKTKQNTFIKVLGEPNQYENYENYEIMIYYFNSICSKGKVVNNSDKSSIRIKFDKKKNYINYDTRIE